MIAVMLLIAGAAIWMWANWKREKINEIKK